MSEESFSCPIWGTEADVLEEKGRTTLIESARAGGRYWLTDTANAVLRSWTNRDWRAVSLTEEIYLGNRNRSVITVDSGLLEGLSVIPPLSVERQFDRFLRLVADMYPEFGEYFNWTKFFHVCELDILAAIRAPAFSNAGTARQRAELFFEGAFEAGYLLGGKEQANARISMDGWRYIEASAATGFRNRQIFVAMWFGTDEQTRLWKEAIEPGVRAAGYAPLRIDNKEHNDKIDDQIIAEIRKSRALVVDMTCGLASPFEWSAAKIVGAPRGGVYYEAGFAMGLGLPVIWSVKDDLAGIDNVVHFDIRQYAQIRWKADDLSDFAESLKNRIEATLGRGDAF